MKKIAFFLFGTFICMQAFSSNYYFSSAVGNDTNNGMSVEKPLKSLSEISKLKLIAGDKIFLKKGDVFYGSIELKNISGNEGEPILISSYGSSDKKPLIDAKGKLNGILIEDCSHIKVSDIEITANGGGVPNYNPNKNYMRCGVFITTQNEGEFSDITIEDLHIRDVFFEEPGFQRGDAEVLTGNGNQNYGWGIRVISKKAKSVLSNILITKCLIENVSHSGIRFTGDYALTTQKTKNIKNIRIINNRVISVGGPAMQASVAENIEFKGNTVDHSGSDDDSRKWGRGSGLWVWGCINALIEHNSFRNANGPGDSAGCHIDFNNTDVVIQYNLSENNAGGFIEILGNNHNCCYRYNVSINDGSRKFIKNKNLGAGVMITVNGYVGDKKPPIGSSNLYIYNNTIYVNDSLSPEVGFANVTKSILIANNIFCLKGHATYDDRIPFRPENGPIKDVVFKNNLYLKADNWPDASQVMITDKAPVYGNPQFVNPGGLNIQDYTPQNAKLIKNKGIVIELIPTDSYGLKGGLKVKTDILGNKIKGLPDMGAIEMK